MAPPTTSAMSVAAATTSACIQNASRGVRRIRCPSTPGSESPVTRPSFADWYWTRTAIAFAATSTHSSR